MFVVYGIKFTLILSKPLLMTIEIHLLTYFWNRFVDNWDQSAEEATRDKNPVCNNNPFTVQCRVTHVQAGSKGKQIQSVIRRKQSPIEQEKSETRQTIRKSWMPCTSVETMTIWRRTQRNTGNKEGVTHDKTQYRCLQNYWGNNRK